MKRSLATTPLLLALPVGLAAAAVAPRLGDLFFQPADGTTLRHSMAVTLSADLDDFEMNAMGQTMGPDEMGMNSSDMTGEVELVFDVVDEVESAERGRTTALVRTYEEMTVNGEVPDEADEGPRQVRFTWDADAGEHEVEVLDDDADDDDREMAATLLDEDMSHRVLLPDGEVAEGDTWSVDVGAEGMLAMFLPGVRLEGVPDMAAAAAAEEEPDAEPFVREGLEMLLESFNDASVDCTFAGEVEEDGRKYSKIDLATEFVATFDPSGLIEEATAMQDDAPEMEATVAVTLSGEGEGSLLWDSEANRLHSLVLEGDWTFDMEADILMIMEGFGEMPMSGIAAWSGTFSSSHDVSEQE